MSALLAGAVAAHTMFLHYVEAGFSENQALRLVAYTIAATPTPEGDGDGAAP